MECKKLDRLATEILNELNFRKKPEIEKFTVKIKNEVS
jgi:hypothetical protein